MDQQLLFDPILGQADEEVKWHAQVSQLPKGGASARSAVLGPNSTDGGPEEG